MSITRSPCRKWSGQTGDSASRGIAGPAMTLTERFARAERSQHSGTPVCKTSFPALVMIQKDCSFHCEARTVTLSFRVYAPLRSEEHRVMTEGTTGSTVPRRQLGRYLRDLHNRSRLTVRRPPRSWNAAGGTPLSAKIT